MLALHTSLIDGTGWRETAKLTASCESNKTFRKPEMRANLTKNELYSKVVSEVS